MARSKVFVNRWARTRKALNSMKNKLEAEGYDAQLLTFDDEFILQARDSFASENAPKAVRWLSSTTGSAAVATLKAKRLGADVEIEVVGGKWLDKAAAMGVSMVVLWPLFVTSSIGMFRQNKLIGRLFDEAVKSLAD